MLKQSVVESICRNTITSHRNAFQVLKERWLNLLGRYENKLRTGSISADTESKVALGGAFSLVENTLPRIFARQPKYKYLGREGDDNKEAELYNEFADYQWAEAKADKNIKKIARWALACGLSGWKIGWKEETIVTKKNGKEVLGVKFVNPMLVDALNKLKVGNNIKVDEQATTANYTIKAIKPFDLIWSVEAEEFEDVRVFGHTEKRLIKELKSEGYDTRNLVSYIKQSQEWKDRISQQDGMTAYQANTMVQEMSVEVAELYTRIMNDEGVYEYHAVTMAYTDTGEPQTIRFEKNLLDKQFIPMGIFRPVDRLGKFYGFGMIEPATGVLDAEEDTLNMSLEALWTDISRPMEYNPTNILDIKSLEYRPRTLVPVRNLGQSVAPFLTPQLPVGSVQYMGDYLSKTKQNLTGITDFQTGADQVGGAKTLGEIRIKTEESNLRLGFIVKAFEEQVLQPIGTYALWLNQQFLADKKKLFYRILGKKGAYVEKQIKFKDIEAIKDIAIVPGSSKLTDQQLELSKWTLLLDKANQELTMPNPVPINKEPIWENILENGLLITDIETYLPNAAEREEAGVQGQMAQLEDAKQESEQPFTARVLPTDDHKVHLEIHQAVAQTGVKANGTPFQPEEMQALVEHINAHTTAMGGVVPGFAQGQEQAVSQQFMNAARPQEPPQPNGK